MIDLVLVVLVLGVTFWVMALAVKDVWQQAADRPDQADAASADPDPDAYTGSLKWTSLDDRQLARLLDESTP
ncbi:MAG: hypothetical protein ABI140_02395 [Jatrophihabitantaceae bacterium]